MARRLEVFRVWTVADLPKILSEIFSIRRVGQAAGVVLAAQTRHD